MIFLFALYLLCCAFAVDVEPPPIMSRYCCLAAGLAAWARFCCPRFHAPLASLIPKVQSGSISRCLSYLC